MSNCWCKCVGMKAIAPYVGQQVIGSPGQLTMLPFPGDRFTGTAKSNPILASPAQLKSPLRRKGPS